MDHFCFSKKIWNPYFYSVSCDKIENGRPFHRLDAGFFKQSHLEKRVALGDSSCFHPNTPIMRKPEKYIDPSRLAISIRLSVMVPLKRQPKRTHTHKRAAKTWSRRNNIRTEQSRKENPKMTTRIDKKQTRTHNKNTTQAETQKKEELLQRRQRIQRTQAQETSWTEIRLCAKRQTQKKTNMKQQRIPYSLKI